MSVSQLYAYTTSTTVCDNYLQPSEHPPPELGVLQQPLPVVLLAAAPGCPARTLQASLQARLEGVYFAPRDLLGRDITASAVHYASRVVFLVSFGVLAYLFPSRVQIWACLSRNHQEAGVYSSTTFIGWFSVMP